MKMFKNIVLVLLIFAGIVTIGTMYSMHKENEADYQEGIEFIKQGKWEEASGKFVMLFPGPGYDHSTYKNSPVLYNYAYSKKEEFKGNIETAAYSMQECPDDYAGEFAADILEYKKNILKQASGLTPEQREAEKARTDEEVAKIAEEHGLNTKPDLEIIETHSVAEEYARYAAGTVKNNTDRNYSYVQVEVILYDDSGAQVGSIMANTNNLEPGGTWKFKAIILEDSCTKYKVCNVTGW